MILLVTHTLAGTKDYTHLFEAIKGGRATTWWHYIDNAWLVKTTEPPNEMIDRLKPHFDHVADSIFIVKIDPYTYNGWLPKAAYEWIRAHR